MRAGGTDIDADALEGNIILDPERVIFQPAGFAIFGIMIVAEIGMIMTMAVSVMMAMPVRMAMMVVFVMHK